MIFNQLKFAMKYVLSRICFSASSLLLFMGFTFSQGVAIGQWREHLPYNSVISVVDNGADIYAATPYAIFVYDKEDFSISRLSKVNKLSDIGITGIEKHSGENTIIITYENGNIDLLKDNAVQNIGDIKRSNIQGSKKINNMYMLGDIVYFSCDFGIVVFDIDRKEVKETWFIGPNGDHIAVYDLCFFNDTIYAGTSGGLYYAYSGSPNLANYSYWHLDSSVYRSGFNYNLVQPFYDKLVINITKNIWDTDTCYYKTAGEWNTLTALGTGNRSQIRTYGDRLIVAQPGAIIFMDTSLTEVERFWSFGDIFLWPNDVIKDSSDPNTWWICDNESGLIKNTLVWINEFILPQGPYTDEVYALASGSGIVAGVPGARDISWNNTYKRGGIFVFSNEQWNNLSQNNEPAFDTIWDMLSIVIDPQNSNHQFIGSYGKGLVELLDNEIVNIYDQSNTPIGGTSGMTNDVRVSGLTYDQDNNLWITTSYTNQCLTVKTSTNQWYNYSFPVISSSDVISDIVVDDYGTKWMILPKGGGMFVFNDNGTFSNTADDKYKRLTTTVGSGNLPSMNVFSIEIDKDGRIWIGTDKGIAVFYYPQNVFSGQNYDAQQILVEVGGYVQPLMESESVNCIVVDGANRKWIGTEKGGAFLLSSDGTSEIFHFTQENSPILSNSIGSIAIMPETGEVFFGTYSGLISYKSTATEGPEVYVDTVHVYAYPNPVRPDYTGIIAVKNLVEDSWVKITDMYGNLILETQALGGQAVWDGKLPDGTKPSSGVFLVFATNADGSETLVTKILFFK